MTVPESVRGKKVRCKGCGAAVPVPTGRAPDTRVTTAEVQAKKATPPISEEEDAKNPYGVTETSLIPRCPHCAYELDPPDARICLNCGYDMVRRSRAPSVKAYQRTFGDWFLWLAPGVGSLIGVGLTIGLCIYYHYYLPEQLFDTWAKNYEAHNGDRFETVGKTLDESYLALIFHPGIETWVMVVGIVVTWKFLKFAFKRLVLNFRPPERIKERLN
jgi:hypothetical protein